MFDFETKGKNLKFLRIFLLVLFASAVVEPSLSYESSGWLNLEAEVLARILVFLADLLHCPEFCYFICGVAIAMAMIVESLGKQGVNRPNILKCMSKI
jgi:Na+-transporting NADH:ubiquinone oxidoreductase subunit NqrF